jgi:hypothetical protein
MKRTGVVVLSSVVLQICFAPAMSRVQAVSCPSPKPSDPPCYRVVCNTQEGEWIYVAQAVGTACDDGDAYTVNDRCYAPVEGSYERVCVGAPFEAQIFNSLEKIKKSRDIVPSTAGAVLLAAQNEFEAFQLAIEPSKTKTVTDLDVSIAPLAGPNGATLDFEIWREQYIYVSTPSGPDGGVGDWPDKLIPKLDTICSSPDGGCRQRTTERSRTPSGKARTSSRTPRHSRARHSRPVTTTARSP